jgi:DNA repair protein RadA/Sms
VARPRAASHYVCQSCAAPFPRWEGQCRACGAWNSLVETLVPDRPGARASRGASAPVGALSLRSLGREPLERTSAGIAEFDRVLGGGIVPGAVLLLGGEPGIGKSTLLLQVAAGAAASFHGPAGRPAEGTWQGSRDPTGSVADTAAAGERAGRRVLYATGEESGGQLHLRASRLGLLDGAGGDALDVLVGTEVDAVIEAADRLHPGLLVVDSIQTLSAAGLEGPAGSVGQVREAAARLGEFARRSRTPVVLVGHVTKDGSLAGPRTLEHLVDVVLMLEGDRYGSLRLLRSMKNRHGSTEEVGVLEMTPDGLRDVADTSRAFLREGRLDAPGLAVAAIVEGSRPLLVEVEALVAPVGMGPPRRTASGIDGSRLALLIAVLGRRAGIDLAARDVYASLAGGVSVGEPALDLPLALALASSHRDRAVGSSTLCCGEVSLLGEVRPVRALERRLREAARLGFRRAIVPAGTAGTAGTAGSEGASRVRGQEAEPRIEVIRVRTLREALEAALPGAAGTTGGGVPGT